MDEQTAKSLLSKIRNTEKQAQRKDPGEINWGQLEKDVADYRGTNRTNQLMQGLMLAGAAGAGLRGIVGLGRMASDVKPQPRQTVDMQVPIPVAKEEEEEKYAKDSWIDNLADKMPYMGMGPKANPGATDNTGIGWVLPASLVGIPAAGALGWKGMDAIFEHQRKRRNKRSLEKAKEDYEEAVLGSYKQGSANLSDRMDDAFKSFEKAAFLKVPGTENVPGQLKGLLATYALLSGPAAYMFVNGKMKKNSQKAILEKAIKERARRAAQQQPFELNAIAKPVEVSNEEEEVN